MIPLSRDVSSLGHRTDRPSAGAAGPLQISPAKSTLLLFGHALTPCPSMIVGARTELGRAAGTRGPRGFANKNHVCLFPLCNPWLKAPTGRQRRTA